jgi:tRNA(Ile)-lysidine synthase
MAAREIRHRFLAQLAHRRKCPVIALAHHADDQAELVLIRLLRGAGSEGLGGMSLVSPSPADPRLQVIRPLLGLDADRIRGLARRMKIPFREDRSNADPAILRNRIRHELLPLLQRDYQPGIRQVLTRTASVLAAEADCIRDLARDWLRRRRTAFDELPLAVRRRAVQWQAHELGVALDFATCERLVAQADCAVCAPGGVRLQRDRAGRLRVVNVVERAYRTAECLVKLGQEGAVEFAGRRFRWRITSIRGSRWRPRPTTRVESFDASAVGSTLLLRHWRVGDRFQPIGMPRDVKLQDLFTNLKVPVGERVERVVAESGSGDIVWVEGLRIGDRFKLGPTTKKRLIWRWTC